MRQGDFKLVAKHNTPWELYNMTKDRSELRDLSKAMPQKAAVLRKLYEDWARRVGAKPWDEVSKMRLKKPKNK